MYGTDVYEYAEDVLSHHGILGMKWGVRRYQNKDGTLTEEGKRRRGKSESGGKEPHPDVVNDLISASNKGKDEFGKALRGTESYKKMMSEVNSMLNSDEYKKPNDEADKKWEELIDQSDDNALWREYAEYDAKRKYPNDEKEQAEVYSETLQNGRKRIDDTDRAWEWYLSVKNPSLQKQLGRAYDVEVEAGQKVAEYAYDLFGERLNEPTRKISDTSRTGPGSDLIRVVSEDLPDRSWMVAQFALEDLTFNKRFAIKHSDEDYLSHHGILGMKWGVRRFQNKDGTLTDAGKRRLGTSESADERRKKKARAKALEKARKTRAEKAEHEKQKQEALKKGSAEDVLKYKGELTEKEMTDALSRLRLEKQLSDLTPKDVDKGRDALSSVISKVNSVSKALNTAANIAESSKRLRNALGFKDEPEETTTQKIAKKMLKDLDEQTGPVDKYPKFNPTNKDGLDSALAWLEKRQKLEDVASGKRINTKKKNK